MNRLFISAIIAAAMMLSACEPGMFPTLPDGDGSDQTEQPSTPNPEPEPNPNPNPNPCPCKTQKVMLYKTVCLVNEDGMNILFTPLQDSLEGTLGKSEVNQSKTNVV